MRQSIEFIEPRSKEDALSIEVTPLVLPRRIIVIVVILVAVTALVEAVTRLINVILLP